MSQRRARKEEEKAKRDEIMAKRRKRRSLEQSLSSAEEKISEAENRITALQEDLAKPEIYNDFDKVRPLLTELNQVKDEVKALYEQWDELVHLLEELPEED